MKDMINRLLINANAPREKYINKPIVLAAMLVKEKCRITCTFIRRI
jgi:hypothetical protein